MCVCFRRGSFEVGAAIVGKLGTVPLAAHGIFVNTTYLSYMIPASVAQSTATIAGNLLGAGEHEEARDVIWLGVITDLFLGIALATTMLFTGRYWCTIYTNDKEVLDMLDAAMPIFAFYCIGDCLKCVTTILLRSTGRPAVTVIGNGVTCLLLMLPLGYALTIVWKQGLRGEWLAMGMSWVLVGCAYAGILARTDWSQQAKLAAERNATAIMEHPEKAAVDNGIDMLSVMTEDIELSSLDSD